MWQRLQTFFLGLVVLSTLGSLYWPLYEHVLPSKEKTYEISAFCVRTEGTYFNYVAILSLVSALVAGITIFLYKRRKLQLQLCGLNFLMIAAAFLVTIYEIKKYFGDEAGGTYGLGAWALIAAMVSNFIARRLILRDQRRVEAADRLR